MLVATRKGALYALLTLGFAASSLTQQKYGELTKEKAEEAHSSKSPYSPYAGRTFPDRPLWGDTHLHTAISLDAGAGGTHWDREAYRFARGEEVVGIEWAAGGSCPSRAGFSRRS